jgi:hypothetical protein
MVAHIEQKQYGDKCITNKLNYTDNRTTESRRDESSQKAWILTKQQLKSLSTLPRCNSSLYYTFAR